MLKKFIAKLVGFREQMEDFSARTYKERSAQESREAEERHRQIMDSRGRKYVSEATIPAEEIERPSNPELKEHQE